MQLKSEFLPEATRKLFERLSNEPLLQGFVLVGGSALALQIGHRLSEDLDFTFLAEDLPAGRVNALAAALEKEGHSVILTTPQSQITSFRINAGKHLLDFARDYAVDGAKLTFFARGANNPKGQLDYLQSEIAAIPPASFRIMGLNGLFAMKMLVLGDRARSRDLFDLMTLIKDHGYSIDKGFELILTLAPIEKRDIERHKGVMTGIIPLDQDDEGFESLGLQVGMPEIYSFLDTVISDYEKRAALKILEESRQTDHRP